MNSSDYYALHTPTGNVVIHSDKQRINQSISHLATISQSNAYSQSDTVCQSANQLLKLIAAFILKTVKVFREVGISAGIKPRPSHHRSVRVERSGEKGPGKRRHEESLSIELWNCSNGRH